MSINQISSNLISTATATGAASTMGKQDFLQLLVTQLKNQDPLSPMESQQFASQLAEFSSVELLTSMDSNLQKGMDSNVLLMNAIQNTMAANFIGKEVTSLGSSVHLADEGDAAVHFKLASNADEVTVTIRDEAGRIVRTITVEGRSVGDNELQWNGKDDNGNRQPAANYSFDVEAKDANGNAVNAIEIFKGKITSVQYVNGSAILAAGGIQIPFADVMQIGLSE